MTYPKTESEVDINLFTMVFFCTMIYNEYMRMTFEQIQNYMILKLLYYTFFIDKKKKNHHDYGHTIVNRSKCIDHVCMDDSCFVSLIIFFSIHNFFFVSSLLLMLVVFFC